MAPDSRRALYIRIAVVSVCGIVSLPSLFLSALALMAGLSAALKEPFAQLRVLPVFWGAVGIPIFWVAWVVLSVAWLRQRRARRLWAVAVAVSGVSCAVIFIPFSVLVLPALGFGLYLALRTLRSAAPGSTLGE